MNLLTADLGNSRLKLRVWCGSSRKPLAAFETPAVPGVAAPIAKWLALASRIEVVALSSVAGSEVEAEVRDALRGGTPDARFEDTLDPGLEIACREPAQVGRDRLFAARGALDLCGDAVVVGAGTALTVDAVRSDGTFLGGAIAPGPALLARALAEGTARLPAVEPRPNPPALGRDTREALRAGIGVGLRGAAKELVGRVAEESGLARAPVVLTGGARAFLLEPPAFDDRGVIVEEDLVHLGLRCVLEAEATSWKTRSRS
jgi:type III pantothenate kinase